MNTHDEIVEAAFSNAVKAIVMDELYRLRVDGIAKRFAVVMLRNRWRRWVGSGMWSRFV